MLDICIWGVQASYHFITTHRAWFSKTRSISYSHWRSYKKNLGLRVKTQRAIVIQFLWALTLSMAISSPKVFRWPNGCFCLVNTFCSLNLPFLVLFIELCVEHSCACYTVPALYGLTHPLRLVFGYWLIFLFIVTERKTAVLSEIQATRRQE